jgi:hypothetical protein
MLMMKLNKLEEAELLAIKSLTQFRIALPAEDDPRHFKNLR